MVHPVSAVPTAVAQPMNPMPVVTATVMPMAPVPTSGFVLPIFTDGIGYNPATPTQGWKKTLCECCADGGAGLCCAACCCGFITGPQLYEKFLGKPGSCKMWAVVAGVLYITYSFMSQMVLNTPIEAPRYLMFSNIQTLSYLGYALVTTFLLMTVRKHVRVKDNIPADCCGEAEDCCCSFWCPCCTMTQLFAQGEIRCQDGYQLCSPEGIPTARGPAVAV